MSRESQDLEFQLNEFYRDHYRRAMKWLSRLTVLSLILTAVLFWQLYDRPQPPYFAAVTTGEVVPMHPLSEPIITNTFIMQWSALTARLIYNLNFSTYQQQLDAIKNRFTNDGWEKMMAALQSGLLPNLTNNRLVISSVVSSSPVILSRMVVGGRFTWRVQMPLLVTYTSASAQRQQTVIVTMDIQRIPTLDAAQGIQIINFKTVVPA